MESVYTFRIWVQDVELWTYSTEVPTARQAPAVVQRTGGTARALLREILPAQLVNGDQRAYEPPQYDPLTGAETFQTRIGMEIVLEVLRDVVEVLRALSTSIVWRSMERTPILFTDRPTPSSERDRREPRSP